MDFRTATDRAAQACITQGDLAEALGVTQSAVARARMDVVSPNARSAPAGWERALAKLARTKAAELVRLAETLEENRSPIAGSAAGEIP